MTKKWEFCRLYLESPYVFVRYFGSTQGASGTSTRDYDAAADAMVQLGKFGWELVSIQHLNIDDVVDGIKFRTIAQSNFIAYFRRSVKWGRECNEPKITLH